MYDGAIRDVVRGRVMVLILSQTQATGRLDANSVLLRRTTRYIIRTNSIIRRQAYYYYKDTMRNNTNISPFRQHKSQYYDKQLYFFRNGRTGCIKIFYPVKPIRYFNVYIQRVNPNRRTKYYVVIVLKKKKRGTDRLTSFFVYFLPMIFSHHDFTSIGSSSLSLRKIAFCVLIFG